MDPDQLNANLNRNITELLYECSCIQAKTQYYIPLAVLEHLYPKNKLILLSMPKFLKKSSAFKSLVYAAYRQKWGNIFRNHCFISRKIQIYQRFDNAFNQKTISKRDKKFQIILSPIVDKVHKSITSIESSNKVLRLVLSRLRSADKIFIAEEMFSQANIEITLQTAETHLFIRTFVSTQTTNHESNRRQVSNYISIRKFAARFQSLYTENAMPSSTEKTVMSNPRFQKLFEWQKVLTRALQSCWNKW